MQDPLLEKLKYATLSQFNPTQLACYVPVSKTFATNESCDLIDQMRAFINHPIQRTALLLGDSGGGKTLFGQHLVNTLWKHYDDNSAIPLWVNLTTIENPGQNLLHKHLDSLRPLEKGCEDLLQRWPIFCEQLLRSRAFFLVLDGGDEINFNGNLFESNGFADKNIKALFTYRTSALSQGVPTHRLFSCSSDVEKNDFYQFEVIPFTEERRMQFLKNYVNCYRKEWKVDDIAKELKKLVDIEELTSNPYYLFLTLEALPAAIAAYAGEPNPAKRIKLTRHYIYQQFVQQYFLRQKDKLVRSRNEEAIRLLNKINEGRGANEQLSLIDLFRDYCQRLAQAMHERKIKQVHYNPGQIVNIINIPEIKMVGSVSQVAVAHSKQEPKDEMSWSKKFFDDRNDPDLGLIRSGCPIQLIGPGIWAFHHASLLDYFIADHLFNSAILDAHIMTGHNLNSVNLQLIPDILRFLVDRAKDDPEFVQVLFQVIELSKYEPPVWKAAANAITILNYAGVMLTGQNFRGVRIGGYDEATNTYWGADLSHSHLHKTDFSEADCRYVKFHKANLREVKFNNAILSGISLGVLSIVEGQLLGFSNDGSWYVVYEDYKKVQLIASPSGKSIRTIFVPSDCSILLNPRKKQVAVTDSKKHRVLLYDFTDKEIELIAFFKNIYYTNDGAYLIAVYTDFIDVFNTITGRRIKRFNSNGKIIQTGYNAKSNQFIVVTSKVIEVIDLATHAVRNIFDFNEVPLDRFFCDSLQGNLLSLNGNTFYVWDVSSDNISKGQIKIENKPFSYCFSLDSKRLVTINTTHVALWDVHTGRLLEQKKLSSSVDPHECILTFNPSGTQFALAMRNAIELWDVPLLSCTKMILEKVTRVSYHPSLPQLLVQGEYTFKKDDRPREAIHFFDINNFHYHTELRKRLKYLGSKVLATQNGLYIVGTDGRKANKLTVYNVKHNLLRTRPFKNVIKNICFDSDENNLVIILESGNVLIMELNQGQIIKECASSRGVSDFTIPLLVCRKDNRQIAWSFNSPYNRVGELNNQIRLWNLTDTMSVIIYNSETGFLDLVYSPDNTLLVALVRYHKLLIFGTERGVLLHTIENFEADFIGFNPINNQLWASNSDFNRSSSFIVWSHHNQTSVVHISQSAFLQGNYISLKRFKFASNGKFLALHIDCRENEEDSSSYTCIAIWNVQTQIWHTFIQMDAVSDYNWVNDEMKIRISSNHGIQQIWQIGNEHKDTLLVASSYPSNSLCVDNLEISNCYGLDFHVLSMLQRTVTHKLKSLTGEPNNTRRVEDVLTGRNKQVCIPEGILRFSVPNNSDFVISSSQWLISLVRKRQPLQNSSNPVANRSAHVWLLIQGITDNNYSYIREIHLFLDQSKPTFLYQSVGAGLIQIRDDKSPNDLKAQTLSRDFVAKCWNLEKPAVMMMLANIEQDQRQELSYLISGYSPGLFGRRAYNCLTWCEEHLRKIGVPIEVAEKDLFCAFPTEHLPDPDQPASNSCLII